MRKMILIMMMLTAVFLISCQAEETAVSCEATLDDIMEGSPFMGITDVTITDADSAPIAGGTVGQMIALNEETLIVSRYASSEDAAEQLAPSALQTTFADLGTVVEDSPMLFGDETSWVQLNDGSIPELAVVRYGDRLLIGQAVMEAGMQEILGGFDTALQAYIGDHPECAYLHPETR